MDFSTLTDDQLLQLLKAAMAEALNRGGPLKMAAEAEVISIQEKAAIQQKVAAEIMERKAEEERTRIEKETRDKLLAEENKTQQEKLKSSWTSKAAVVAAIREWGYDGEFELNIWSRGSDRRVYFQKNRRGDWKFCLYLTGNSKHPPMDFEGEGADCWFDDKLSILKALLKVISEQWKGDVQMSSEIGDVEPSAKKLQCLRDVLKLQAVSTNV